MSDIESNTNSVVEDRSKFFLGEELNKSEAQTQINTEGADSVYESKYGLYFDKIWIDGSHSNLDKSTTSTSSTSTTSSSTSSSSTSSSSTAAADTTTTTSDLDLAPEVEKLEASAGKLETAADELKAEHDNAAVDKFEAAAGKVARAAEEVRENPTDENAIEELETAADELKNAAHALEGEIGDEQYEKIETAVDAFEKATDQLLAADDGEADMAGAVSKATKALDTLVDATTGAEVAADVDTAVDPYQELDTLSDKLNSLTSGLMDKFSIAELDAYEEATELLEEAIDAFIADPTSEASIEGLEKAADALTDATDALDGKIDAGTYKDVSAAVTAFEEVVDKLAGLDGLQSEVDAVAAEIVTALKEVVRATKEGIEGDSATGTTTTADDTATATDTETDVVAASTWTVDQETLTIQLDNGYSITLENANQAWTITDADGNSTRIWGDPHVDENADGTNDWDFYNTTTFTLDDDTKITVGTTDYGNGATVTDTLTITNGDQAINVTGVADNNVQISEVLTGGEQIDQDLADGEIRLEGEGANNWSEVIEQNVIDDNPYKDIEKATDDLKTFADGLGDTYSDIPELKAFEVATDNLETAGNKLLTDPSQENIEAFEVAANELKAATHALEGKIDDSVYQQAATAIDDFEAAIDLVTVYSADGDTDDMDAQIALAIRSLQSLASIVIEAVSTSDDDTVTGDTTTATGTTTTADASGDTAGVDASDETADTTGTSGDDDTTTTTADTTTDTGAESDVVEASPFLTGLEQVTNDLKNISDGLGANTDIPEIAKFETATINLERAANEMLADPSQENIDLFEEASDKLKAVTDKLKGAIDDTLYEGVTEAVNEFVAAVDEAIKLSEAGDIDGTNAQITLATSSLQSLIDLVKEALTPAETNPASDALKAGIEGLKSISDGLGANTGIPEIAKFETATINLERAGNQMLADPTQENIDLFEEASDKLKAATDKLKGVIDDTLYEGVTGAVNKFVAAVDEAIKLSEAGDIEGMNEQVILAASSLNELTGLVKEAITPVEVQAGGSEIDDADREDEDV